MMRRPPPLVTARTSWFTLRLPPRAPGAYSRCRSLRGAVAGPCLRPRGVAGTVPSAPGVGRSRVEASGERVIAGKGPIGHRDLTPSGHTELLTQDVRMSLRRSRGDAETFTDFFVRTASGDELDD